MAAAVDLSAQRAEGRVFEDALREVRLALSRTEEPGCPSPRYRDEATRALGVELERERSRKRTLDAAGVSTEAVSQRILEIRKLMDLQIRTQQGVVKSSNEQKLRVQTVLEFFGQEAVARVVEASPKLQGLK